MRRRYYFNIAKLLFIVITPVVLILLPADALDHGRAMCISRVFFDFECFACGISRACMPLIHLDFEGAFEFNMASFIVLPLLIILWIQWFFKEWKMFKRYRAVYANKVVG